MQAQLSWVPLVQGFSWGCNQAATWDCGLIWRLTGVGWRDLLPSSLMQWLAGLIPLPHGPFQRVPHGMLTDFPQQGLSKRVWETTAMTEATAVFIFFLIIYSQKWHLIVSAIFSLLEASYKAKPMLKQRGPHRVWMPRGRDQWGPSQKLPPWIFSYMKS